jgi:hypothetical protein
MTLLISPSQHVPQAQTGDRELLRYVGRHGAVSIDHVMSALGLGQAATYRRVAALIDAGLLERLNLLRGEPSLLRSSRSGLRYAGLGMGPAIVSPGAVDHWLRCATVAGLLADRFGPDRILTERELAFAERHERSPIASAKIGELPDGRPRLHRPDLVVLPPDHHLMRLHREGAAPYVSSPGGNHVAEPGEDDEVISVEVELTPKSPKRLREIVRGWRRASWIDEVHYLCEPGQTRRAVERAVEKLHAQDRIVVGEVPSR